MNKTLIEYDYFEELGKNGVGLKNELIRSLKKSPDHLARSLGYSDYKHVNCFVADGNYALPHKSWGNKQCEADRLVLTKHLMDARRK